MTKYFVVSINYFKCVKNFKIMHIITKRSLKIVVFFKNPISKFVQNYFIKTFFLLYPLFQNRKQ